METKTMIGVASIWICCTVAACVLKEPAIFVGAVFGTAIYCSWSSKED